MSMTRRRFGLVMVLVQLLVTLSACNQPGNLPNYSVTRFAMETVVEYTISHSGDDVTGIDPERGDPAAREAVELAHAEIQRISSLLWEGDSLSAVFQINASSDSVRVDSEVTDFLDRSIQYNEMSGGAFDITIEPVLSLYAFTSDDARPPPVDSIRLQLELIGIDGFHVGDENYIVKSRPDVRLAVGGVAKGYGVDRAVEILRSRGITGAVVNAGGDLYCLGTNNGRPWRVGIRDPDDAEGVVRVLNVSDEAVATSGDYQRFFVVDGVRYHHILDPSTGKPARGTRSATVIAATTEMADALATAAFVLGAQRGIEMLEAVGANGMLIDAAGQIHATRGLSEYLDADADR
jgi:thiamine biosynthesis lipoprotein